MWHWVQASALCWLWLVCGVDFSVWQLRQKRPAAVPEPVAELLAV